MAASRPRICSISAAVVRRLLPGLTVPDSGVLAAAVAR